MNELSGRAKSELEKQRLSVTHNLAWLEQALLAESRLVWAEAVRIGDMYESADATFGTAKALRAAAEKEVGK